jgi:hypothetical protein
VEGLLDALEPLLGPEPLRGERVVEVRADCARATLITGSLFTARWVASYLTPFWRTGTPDLASEPLIPRVRAWLDTRAELLAAASTLLTQHSEPVVGFMGASGYRAAHGGTVVAWCPGQRTLFAHRPASRSVIAIAPDQRALALAATRLLRELVRHRLQRDGWLYLHAGAAARQGRVVAFVGRKGAGKTAATFSLVARRGWHLLASDRVFVKATPSGATVVPWAASSNIGLGFLRALGWHSVVARAYRNGVELPPNQDPDVTREVIEGHFRPVFRNGAEKKLELMPDQFDRWFKGGTARTGELVAIIHPHLDLDAEQPRLLQDRPPPCSSQDLIPGPGERDLYPDFLGLASTVGLAAPGDHAVELDQLGRVPRAAVLLGPDPEANASLLESIGGG